MLDLKFVRDNVDRVNEMLRNRRLDTDLKAFVVLDENRRRVLRQVEELKYRRNLASEEISASRRKRRIPRSGFKKCVSLERESRPWTPNWQRLNRLFTRFFC